MGLETLFALWCAEMKLQPDACHAATKAASMQVGIYQQAQAFENALNQQGNKLVKKYVFSYTGENVWGIAFFVAKTARDKEVGYVWRTRSPIVETVGVRAGENGGSLTLGWTLK
jgi:hypothetical protein